MQDLLEDARERFKTAIADHVTSDCGSVAADPWIISSLLQKSIRRGETAIAQRAALTFLNLKGSAIWRRLTVIAFEDVGVGSIDAVTAGVAASSDAAFRKACGGNERVAIYLASVMAKVAKDRSADFICGAKDHRRFARLSPEWRWGLGQGRCRSVTRHLPRTERSRGLARGNRTRRCAHPGADYVHAATPLAGRPRQQGEQSTRLPRAAAGDGRRRSPLFPRRAHPAWPRGDLALCLRERRCAGLP